MSIKFLVSQLIFICLLYISCTYLKAPTITFPILMELLILTIFIKINTAPPQEIKRTHSKKEVKSKPKKNKDLEMAAHVQQGLMSVNPPILPNIKIAKACHAAKNVGGDFYTFIYREDVPETQSIEETPGVIKYMDKRSDYLGIAIADVAGHGLSSALVMALTAGITREVGYQHKSPAITLETVNSNLHPLIKTSHIPYVTMVYGVIQPETLSFTYSKAGHCPILYQTQDGDIYELESEGIFLGMYKDESYEEKTCQLSIGDRLIFYTDGLTESRNENNEFFGEDRLKENLQKYQHLHVEETHNKIYEEIDTFTKNKPLSDDQTLVIVAIT